MKIVVCHLIKHLKKGNPDTFAANQLNRNQINVFDNWTVYNVCIVGVDTFYKLETFVDGIFSSFVNL